MTDVPWLSDDEQETWLLFVRLMVIVMARLDSQLRSDAGISHYEYAVLAGLSASPERTIGMSRLASMANGSLSRLSHAVKRLESQGLVRRAAQPGNGRLTQASLTEAGYAKLVAAAPGHVQTVRRLVMDCLDASQREQLRDISRTILESAASPEDLQAFEEASPSD